MTGFAVDLDELDAQVRRVDAVAERVRRAAGAGRPLDLGAYGVLGQVFALAAVGAAAAGSAAVTRAAGAVADLGAGVRAARLGYLRADRQAAAGLAGPRRPGPR